MIAVFPGSFDPFTIGHESLVSRSLSMFDKIIIAVGVNSEKPGFFDIQKRIFWIKKVFENEPKIKVETYQGLTIDFCKKVGSSFILRGLRSYNDFEFERQIAQLNKTMMPEIETVFLLTLPEHSHITSSLVREIIKNKGNPSAFLPVQIEI